MKRHFYLVAAVALLVSLVAFALLVSPMSTITANAAAGAWRGEYYGNPWLVGAPLVTRDDASVSFDWGGGSPAASVPGDNFSARWTNMVDFAAGAYRFTVESDDGVRLFVDGNLVIDHWSDSPRASYSADVSLSGGAHAIRLEYYEHSGTASVWLSWEPIPVITGGNIITCVRPSNSWIKVYRLDGDQWVDLNPHGWGPIDASGFLKIDGMPVDVPRYGASGHPYRVELWAEGSLIRSVGNTANGEPEFRVYVARDNYTPWGCPAP